MDPETQLYIGVGMSVLSVGIALVIFGIMAWGTYQDHRRLQHARKHLSRRRSYRRWG